MIRCQQRVSGKDFLEILCQLCSSHRCNYYAEQCPGGLGCAGSEWVEYDNVPVFHVIEETRRQVELGYSLYTAHGCIWIQCKLLLLFHRLFALYHFLNQPVLYVKKASAITLW